MYQLIPIDEEVLKCGVKLKKFINHLLYRQQIHLSFLF